MNELARLIPQADSLAELREVVKAVDALPGRGLPEVGQSADLSPRHADYYVAAGELLGLLTRDGGLRATEAGRSLLTTAAGSAEEARLWSSCIRESDVLQRLAPGLLDAAPPGRAALSARIALLSGLSRSTSERRAGCLLRWRAQVRRALGEDNLSLFRDDSSPG